MSSIVRALLLSSLVVGCQLLGGADEPVLSEASLGSTANVHLFGGVYTSGQPAPADMAALQAAGVRTVINLRAEGELDYDEGALVQAVGMTYHNPGWNGPDQLTDARFDELRALLNTAEQPILFHCGSANRVGAHWLTWRVLDGGLTVEQAEAEAATVGLRTEAFKVKALDYIARQQAAH